MLLKSRPGAFCPQGIVSGVLLKTFIFLSVFSLSFIEADSPPAPGVTTELRCDEGTGTTAADASGNAHSGTLTNGPTWVAGKYGQGINLDGTNDYINLADHADYTLNPSTSYTWSSWVKNNNFNQWSTVWSQTVSATNFFYFYAHTSADAEAGPVTNGLSVYWYSGNNKLVIHSNNNVLTAGTWSYVTVTYDASQAQANRFTIYVNGTDVTNRSDIISAGTLASIDPTNIRIGSNQPFGEYLNGAVDEVRYYKRLLSVAEIQSDMNTGNTTDATAPAVNITAPVAGVVSGTINVTANASDNIGVAGVQFLLDGVNLGAEDISAPYSVSWNTTTASTGSHNLTARARDAAGNTTTSSIVIVNVNNSDVTAPTVNITAPAAGNVSGTISATANASDNVGVAGVQFLLDGNNLGSEDVSAPYSVSWNTTTATNGSHNLTARARDAAGNTTTSSTIIVNVNNDITAPTVNIITPPAGTVSGTFNVTANASDNIAVVGVQFLLDGNNLDVEDVAAPYNISWNTQLVANGAHTLTARARDAAGNSTTSAPIAVTINNNDITVPTVTITTPPAGTVSGTFNVTANASDNIGVVGVQFLLDGNNLDVEDVAAPYNISWNTITVTNGAHTLTARARDAAGNSTTSAPVAVTVNNDITAPSVNITAPAAGNVLGTISVTANASDNVGVAGVQFLLDGNNLGSEDVSAPYSVSWNTTTATNGSHNLTARARDAIGNTTTSVTVVVNVNNDITGPTVSVNPPAVSPVSGTINVDATAADNVGVVGVQFLLDGNNLGSEDVSAPYSVSWNTLTASNATHSITARARDAAGNITTSASTPFVVLNNGLVASFGFNENSGTVANDNSGNNNNGTLTNGPTWSASGKYGAAILFDGSNDLVNINDANSLDLTNGMTIEAWVNPSNVTGYKTVVCKENGTSNLAYTLSANNSTSGTSNQRPDSRIRIGSNTRTVTGATKLSLNTWTHVACTYDGTTMRLYVNGVQTATFATSGNITTTTNLLRIGGSTALGTQYFAGLIDEVRIYNRALSQASIQSDMNTPIAPDATSPSVNITAPAAASNILGTVNVTANASDNISVSGVQFLLNGNNLGAEDVTAPYSVSWNTTVIADGNYTLTARARDAAGNSSTSSAVAVMIDNTLPTATITAPASPIAGTISISASANDNVGVAGVQFLLNGANLGSEDLVAPYTVQWNTTTVTDGNYTLTARVRDVTGNTALSTAVLADVLNHPPDTELPTINITAPSAGNDVDGTINVTANGSDNVGVVGVQFLLNGNNLGAEDVSAPYSVSWNTTALANGPYTLTARARDAAGNTRTSAEVVINVNHPPDTGLPQVNLTAPAAGNVSGVVNITANATDNIGVIGVQFQVNGVPEGPEDLTPPYSYSWNTNGLMNGFHVLTAVARDAAGNTSTSSEVSVTVNNDIFPPSVSITAPAAGDVSGTISVTANASDNISVTGVQFLLNGNNLGSEDVSAPYSVSWNTTALANGTYTLTARARDASGNSATSEAVVVNINNDITAPAVSITAPTAGTVSATVNITANASDNVGVVGVQYLLDGNNLGSENTVAPYSFSWNTTTATNGAHTLTARARDAAGNSSISQGIAVTVSNITSTTNLLTAIPFNEGSGTAAADVSGKAHHGTLSGATWTPGKYGQSVNLNGTSGYVNIADHNDYTLDPALNYTWSAWVKNNSFKEWSTVWSQTINNSNFFYFYAHTSTDPDGGPVTNGISVYWWINGGASKIGVHSSNNVLTTGQWSHVAVTYDASQPQNNRFTIYVNGVDVTVRNDVSSAGTITAINPTNIRIGSNQPFGEYLNGAVDEVRYYNRLLTMSEVQSDMNTPLGTDLTAPTVNITAPAAGNVSGTISVTANASDNLSVAGVQFLVDGNNIGSEDLTSPYSVSLNTATLSTGNHTLTARARDAAGNATTSAGVIINVNNLPDTELPTVAITSPAAGNVLGTINVNATANDNVGVVGVQFLLDGNTLGAEDITAPYSTSWNTIGLSNGQHILTARARDAAGNTGTSSQVIVNINNDVEPPSVTVSIPSQFSSDVSGTIAIDANANDNIGVIGVQFFLDGNLLGSEDLVAPYTVSLNTTTITNGDHTITARARDAAGNSATSSGLVITVNNIPDTEDPTVSITSPSAGSVSGTISVSADANDNTGVVGVQFLLDGNNLGSEDLTAPYSINWNTGMASNGGHTISAKVRDAAGNTSFATNVNVTVANTTPVISGISVSAVTESSVVISWTTNLPATSQVNYGTTASYGLNTLTDANLVISHSQILNGLLPGTLYHYQVISGNSNGAPAISGDNTFTTASLTASLGTLNTHTILAYPAGKIVPWTLNPTMAYDTVMDIAWNYLLNSVPNDPSTGKPAYYSRSYLNPNTQQVVNWDHNPAGLYGMLTESALKYYAYSGNTSVVQLAINVATWHLDHGMTTASDSWASVPYSEGAYGSLNYGGANQADGVGNLEPDKIGELAYAWLQLYKYNGNTRFRDAAIQAGNVLAAKVRTGSLTQSPWPFRVKASNGAIIEDYCANTIAPISLLDGLIAAGLGNTAAYQTARTTAWTWLMTYPIQNNIWSQYFEDVSVQGSYNSNLNQYDANMTARYLLEHPEFDPNWEAHVRSIIAWVETKFGQTQYGSLAIAEQTPVFPYIMGSHTSRYASVNALLYEKTGDLDAKEKAYRSFNWATYMTRNNGVVIDGLLYGSESNANQWFSDGYGDYIRHFMTGLGAVPEWSPANQTHLVRSSSVLKNIVYGPGNISYTTYDGTSTEVIHLNFTPVSVTADGVELPQRSDLTQPGWTIDVNTKTIRIYHVGATQITVSDTPAQPLITLNNNIDAVQPAHTIASARKSIE